MYKLKPLLVIGFAYQLAAQQFTISSFVQTIDDCLRFGELIDYTYNLDITASLQKPYGNQYELVQCDFAGICPDSILKTTCVWQRYLSVDCSGSTNSPRIKIFSNSLPNHCYFAQTSYPIGSSSSYNAYGFDVAFNQMIGSMAIASQYGEDETVYKTNLRTETDLNSQLCSDSWSKASEVDSAAGYNEFIWDTNADQATGQWITEANAPNYPLLRMPNSNRIVGIALNGVFFFTGTSEQGYDAFFPKNYNLGGKVDKVAVDQCLGSAQSHNTYRYHMYSPCIYTGISLRDFPASCSLIASCDEDVTVYATKNTPVERRTITPIGLAKDGRVIYGPFKMNGDLWQPCDVDVCNGRLFGTSYGYVTTMFHPYTISCFGPGNKLYHAKVGCSQRPRECTNAVSLFSSFVISFGFIMGALALIF
ncbi:UNKNOWN [Stylonychia lemnae]|uniref:Uncharacterized protein n=1 Tax=Stylonychia lemnae TaxID=5949 RepID=A0A078BB59_STYLE|nr:UNKNOWN [Stylonychia lemnae]|eukprot:CDW91426.1 UNKNOWN [Stylonychia lemnae]